MNNKPSYLNEENESVASSRSNNSSSSNNKRKKPNHHNNDDDDDDNDDQGEESGEYVESNEESETTDSGDDSGSNDDSDDSDDSDSDDDDDDWNEKSSGSKSKKLKKKNSKKIKNGKKSKKSNGKKPSKKQSKSHQIKPKKRHLSDVEEGEVSDGEDRQHSNKNNHKQQQQQQDDHVTSSDMSSSSESSVFNDGYDSDLLGDEEDRRRLDNLTEKEREEEIYRRTEQRDLLMKRFEINKKIKQQQRVAYKAEKQKRREERKKLGSSVSSAKKKNETENSSKNATKIFDPNDTANKSDSILMSADGDDLNQSSSTSAMDRRKTNESKRKDTGVSKALANLKADREKKKQLAEDKQRLEKMQQQKKLRTEDVFSSSSSDEDDDDDENNKKRSNRRRNKSSDSSNNSSNDHSGDSDDSDSAESSEDSSSSKNRSSKSKIPIGTKDDLNKMKLSRFRIEKWCHAPFFKQVACGSFVRIGIGLNAGVSIYRVAEIVDVVETAKVYQLGTTRTNKGLKLKHGGEERTYRLEFVSNQLFSDDEFKRWRDALVKSNLPLPTLRDMEAKSKQIESYNNYSLKDEDYDFIVKEKKRFSKDTEKIAEKKIDLLKKREAAIQANDSERLKEIDELIRELDEKATDQTVKRSGNFNMLASINERNRMLTSRDIEEAMTKESARLKEQKDDPFQRRKGFFTLVANVKSLKKTNQTNETGEANVDDEANEDGNKAKANEQIKKEQENKNNKKNLIFEDLLAPSSIIKKPAESVVDLPSVDPKIISSNLETSKLLAKTTAASKASNNNDLFQAHNFDIKIDLDVPIINTNQLQPIINSSNVFDSSQLSRRTLNLDEYKKKKGLI